MSDYNISCLDSADDCNSTNFDYYQDLEQYSLPVFGSIQFVVLSLAALVTLIGNGIVLAMIVSKSSLQTIQNFYILSVALADILFTLSVPFHVSTFFLTSFIFGSTICKLIISCFGQIPVFMNNSFLVYLCIDCYLMCRKHTLVYRKKLLRILTGVTWITGIILCIPFYLNSSYHETYRGRAFCFDSGLSPYKLDVLVVFIIPFIMILIYISLMYVPKSIQGNGIDQETLQHRRLVILMSVSFCCCQFPFWLHQATSVLYPIQSLFSSFNIFFLVVPLLWINTALNAALVLQFSQEMKSALLFWRKNGNSSPTALECIAPP